MKRDELSNIIRAAARILDDPNVVVIGSQSILASYPEVTLPSELTFSIEADLLSLGGDDDADKIDGAIGEGSHFHETFGVYGQGVGAQTAVLADGWKDCLVPRRRDDWCSGLVSGPARSLRVKADRRP